MTDERAEYGHATLDCPETVVAGSYASWTIQYTVGALGMDDGSTLKVASNVSSDWGVPQFEDPAADNYATVETSGDAAVEAEYDPHGHVRPMRDTVTVHVSDGSLEHGDTITLTLGDRSGESLGHQAQSFPERDFELWVLVDPFETGELARVPGELRFDFVAGPAEELVAVAPSTSDGTAEVRVRGVDFWGNAARGYEGTVAVEADGETLAAAEVTEGAATVPVELEEGVHRLRVADEERGLATTTNPVVVDGDHDTLFWGDIHGQSGETVGTGTVREYFEFARDYGFLDFASHAGNDFQITESLWDTIQDAVGEFHDPGEFVTFLCYEWSANSPNGGDHNVYFRGEEAELHPSSSWQSATEDGGPRHDGTCPVADLYERYEGREDVFIIPHQGGRPARYGDWFDPELTPFVEILSVWGVFEWFGREALDREYPVGFVAGSDDHTGRLGASRPTNEADWAFPVDGGMMAAYAEDLSRDTLWESFEERRIYGTTGARILLDVAVAGAGMGEDVAVDGDPQIDVSVHGTAPLQRLDVFRGAAREPIATEFFDAGEDRIELTWTGASSKDRHKIEDWSGALSLDAGRVADVEEVGFDHPTAGVTDRTNTTVRWEGTTAGNYQGLRVDLDAPEDATLTFAAGPVNRQFRVGELDERRVVDAGFLDRRLELRPVGESSTLDAERSVVDADAGSGTTPYYVRVRQVDGEMAWSSPVFVST
jgi:hypothetical protein